MPGKILRIFAPSIAAGKDWWQENQKMQYVLSENYPKIKNHPRNTIRKPSEFTFRTEDHQIHNFSPSFLTHLHTLTSNYPKTYIDYPKINRMCLATESTGDLAAATLPAGAAAILKSTIRKSTVP